MDSTTRRFASLTFLFPIGVCLLLLARSSWAEELALATGSDVNISSATTGLPGEHTSEKRLSVLAFWSIQGGFQSPSDPNYSAENDLDVLPSYKLSDSFSLIGDFGYKKELSQQQRLTANNALVGVSHSAFQLLPYLKFSPRAGIVAPFNEQARSEDSLITALSTTAVFDWDGAAIGARGLTATYWATFKRSFYQYYTSGTGETNIEFNVKHTGYIGYAFNDTISFLQTVIYDQGWNYIGHMKQKFELDEELDFKLSKNFSIGAGLSNSGDVMAANQQDSNVEIYNPNSASVFGNLIFRL